MNKAHGGGLFYCLIDVVFFVFRLFGFVFRLFGFGFRRWRVTFFYSCKRK